MEAKILENTALGMLISTAIMALGAITFSALIMAFTRSHNRKSIRPFCNIHKCITDTALSISIQNAGMGPMLIQQITLLKNLDDPIQKGVPCVNVFESGLYGDVFIQKTDGYTLASLGELNLFRFSVDTTDNGKLIMLKAKLKDYILCVQYADVYDDIYIKKEGMADVHC